MRSKISNHMPRLSWNPMCSLASIIPRKCAKYPGFSFFSDNSRKMVKYWHESIWLTWSKTFTKAPLPAILTSMPSLGYLLLRWACRWNVKHQRMQLESMLECWTAFFNMNYRFKVSFSILLYTCSGVAVFKYGSMWLKLASNNTIYPNFANATCFFAEIYLFGRPLKSEECPIFVISVSFDAAWNYISS